jgi:hypothetical protein
VEARVILGERPEEIASFTLPGSRFSVRVHVQFEVQGSMFEVRAKRGTELEHEQRRENIEA